MTQLQKRTMELKSANLNEEILVTGRAGFIASALAERLVQDVRIMW